MSRAHDLSGSVARHLSGCHSAPKGVRNDADASAAGDTEDEIRGSVRGMERRTAVIATRGLFSSFYSDRGSHYWHTPDADGKVDRDKLTQFGRAMKQLGRRWYRAWCSPLRVGLLLRAVLFLPLCVSFIPVPCTGCSTGTVCSAGLRSGGTGTAAGLVLLPRLEIVLPLREGVSQRLAACALTAATLISSDAVMAGAEEAADLSRYRGRAAAINRAQCRH